MNKKPSTAQRIAQLESITSALNTALVAVAYSAGVKSDSLDKTSMEEYVKYVHEQIHPLVRRADQIVGEVAKVEMEKQKAAVKEEATDDTAN